MGKLYIFKDQKDLEKTLTEDKIVNIIGTKGSGKTTSSLPYIENDDYIVINCDRLFELPSDEQEDRELSNIRNILKKKYGELPTGKEFLNCYNDIVKYILSKNKKALIEGNVIQGIEPKCLKGKIIVKRTAVFKSFIRAVKRDYQNQYFMNLEKEKHKYLYKLIRLYKITKRRLNVFKTAKEIEKIMESLENRPIITAGAIIIDNEKKILLVKRPSNKKLFPNAWSFPGGKHEEGESLDETVVREVKEETGLDLVSFKKYSFNGNTPQNTWSINHLYIGKAEGILIPETEAKRYSYDEVKGLEIAFNQMEIMGKLHNDGIL